MAGVGAAVLCIGVQDVESHEAEVISGPETMALGHWLVIAEPLNLGQVITIVRLEL